MKTLAQLLQEGYQFQQRLQFEEAAGVYRQILRIQPNSADVIGLLGTVRLNQFRYDEALHQFDKAVRLEPDTAHHYYHRGIALQELRRFAEAAADLLRAYELNPDIDNALSNHAQALRAVCDWNTYDWLERKLTETIRSSSVAVSPFYFLQFSDEPADQLLCARTHALRKGVPPSISRRLRRPRDAKRGRIRLGYLSADFREHAIGQLLVELIESHDRNRFEVSGISLGVNDRSDLRARFEASFDHFVDLKENSDDRSIRRIDDLDLDILVDLAAHTSGNFMAALAYGFAPIQVNYLGYPGTIGADFVDYIIVDPFVVPAEQQPFFTEKIVHLPDCYQVNSRRAINERVPSRAECGLPEDGFVFCCFNNNFKITPRMFDIWMRLLSGLPGSVLWILKDHADVEPNLRREAESRGVDPVRLVFAPRVPSADHLARHRCADLFLDTLPYNAHTTASDALWAGLPIVTCAGKSFQSRVAGSLLHAIGLPDLITSSLQDYEALALSLATQPERLQEVRARLARNRLTSPLFDLDRYRRHIEAAYETMVELSRSGEAPRAFAVEPIGIRR